MWPLVSHLTALSPSFYVYSLGGNNKSFNLMGLLWGLNETRDREHLTHCLAYKDLTNISNYYYFSVMLTLTLSFHKPVRISITVPTEQMRKLRLSSIRGLPKVTEGTGILSTAEQWMKTWGFPSHSWNNRGNPGKAQEYIGLLLAFPDSQAVLAWWGEELWSSQLPDLFTALLALELVGFQLVPWFPLTLLTTPAGGHLWLP